MSKTMLILMACASVLVGLASGQSAKPLQSTNRSPMQTADDKAKAQARPLLEAADMYLALGDGDAARAQILEALKAIEGDGVTEATKSQVRGAVKTRIENLRKAKQAASDTAKQAQLASQDKTKRKNLAQLEVAQSLLSNSKPDEALRVVQQVLGESNNPEVIAKANEILEMIGSPWGNFLSTVWQHLLTVFQWLSDIIIGGFVFFVLYWLLKAGRNVSVGKHGKKWKVNPI
jgi:hypothetical protein